MENTVVDTKGILLNLLYMERKKFVSVARLKRCIAYVYDTLVEQKTLCNYNTYFDTEECNIIQQVLYSSTIFCLDNDMEMVYLRENVDLKGLVDNVVFDDYLLTILNNFVKEDD